MTARHLVLLGLVLLAGRLLVSGIRLLQGHQDRKWHNADRERYEASQRAAACATAKREVARVFPWIAAAELGETGAESDPLPRLRRAVSQTPGARLGSTTILVGAARVEMPVIWPESERSKHGYIVGRTGSGKTTLLLQVLAHDLSAGHGVCVIGPERELFLEWALPMSKGRLGEVVYFAPGDPACPVGFNPILVEDGDDPDRLAGEVFAILGSVVGDDLGPRSSPLLANALQVLVGRPNATLADIPRLLTDRGLRERVVADAHNSHAADFWRKTYPSFPAGAHFPVVNRLDAFLRSASLRTVLSAKRGFSMRKALETGQVLLVDLGGLAPEVAKILGQLVVARLQLELLRRETKEAELRRPFRLFCDEFQAIAPQDATSWATLLSRGRRYGLGIVLAHQFPGQLPSAVRDEILGNVSGLFVFGSGVKDAEVLRKDLLQVTDGERLEPVSVSSLVNQPVGRAIGRLAGNGTSLVLASHPPLKVDRTDGRLVRDASWRRHDANNSAGKVPEEPLPTEGRGGAAHRSIQAEICRLGVAAGFRARPEWQVPGGRGRVDVVLEQGGRAAGFEVSLTTQARHELGNVRKCLTANLNPVVVVSSNLQFRKDLDALLATELPQATGVVRIVDPAELPAVVSELKEPGPGTELVAGFRLVVDEARLPPDERDRRLCRIGAALAAVRARQGEVVS